MYEVVLLLPAIPFPYFAISAICAPIHLQLCLPDLVPAARLFQMLFFLGNQASLGNISQTVAGIYGERKYMLEELNFTTAAVGIPVTGGGVDWL